MVHWFNPFYPGRFFWRPILNKRREQGKLDMIPVIETFHSLALFAYGDMDFMGLLFCAGDIWHMLFFVFIAYSSVCGF